MPFLGKAPGTTTVNVADDAITTAKIADNAITSAKIGVDVIVAEDLAANSVTVSEITDDAVTQAKIADEAVDEARLQISNAGTNGQFLSKQSGNTGGLTWADAGITGITSSADATAMTIDSSERIVMPSQPMFYATTINAVSGGSLHTESSYEYNNAGDTSNTIQGIGFAKIWINIGSHFSNTTGVFTVPVAGRYLAWFNNNYHINTNWTSAYMMWNAKVVGQAWVSHLENPSQYDSLVAWAIVEAAVNDKIWPGYHSGYGAPHTATAWGYHQCGIMLIG